MPLSFLQYRGTSLEVLHLEALDSPRLLKCYSVDFGRQASSRPAIGIVLYVGSVC